MNEERNERDNKNQENRAESEFIIGNFVDQPQHPGEQHCEQCNHRDQFQAVLDAPLKDDNIVVKGRKEGVEKKDA